MCNNNNNNKNNNNHQPDVVTNGFGGRHGGRELPRLNDGSASHLYCLDKITFHPRVILGYKDTFRFISTFLVACYGTLDHYVGRSVRPFFRPSLLCFFCSFHRFLNILNTDTKLIKVKIKKYLREYITNF